MKNPKASKKPLLLADASSPSANPTHDEIAHRAYSIWEEQARPQGQDSAHWFQAESELRQAQEQRAARR